MPRFLTQGRRDAKKSCKDNPLKFLRLAKRSLLMILVLALTPVGLARSADPVRVRVLMAPVTSLDPVSLQPADRAGRDLVENLFMGLTRYDPASGQIQPALAREWSVSSDGLTWTFKLRNDIKWVTYNSTSQKVEAVRPVVAGDFLYGIRRACSPTPPNPVTHEIFIIAGCRIVATTNTLLVDDIFIARILGVKVINAQTLEIKILFPAPYFVSLLALPEFRAVPREAVSTDPDWTKLGVIITDGPYVINVRDANTMMLIRNPLWPDAPTGNIDQVNVAFTAADDAIAQGFKAGSVDFARLNSLSPQITTPGILVTTPGPMVTVLGFSAERAIIQKDAFRRALALAIDRNSLIKQAGLTTALPTSRLTPPGTIGGPTDPPDNSGFNAAAAKASLTAAGYPECRLSEKQDLLVEDTPPTIAIAKALVSQWGTVLGCAATTFTVHPVAREIVQSAAHGSISTIETNDSPRPQLWIYSWTPDYPDANAWTGDGLHCQYGFMRTGVACGNADAQVDAAGVESDPAKRAATYTQAETLWFGPSGTFPVAPLYISQSVIARQPGLKGATANGPARFDLWTLSK